MRNFVLHFQGFRLGKKVYLNSIIFETNSSIMPIGSVLCYINEIK